MAEASGNILAFVHIPKTAGVTLNYMLRNSFGIRHCDVESRRSFTTKVEAEDLRAIKSLHPELRSIAGHHLTVWNNLEEVFPGIRYLTLLREPVARMASFYQYQVQRMGFNKPFENWIAREKKHNVQVRRIAGTDDPYRAIDLIENRFAFVGLTERFDESMLLLLDMFPEFGLDIRYKSSNVAVDNSIKQEIMGDDRKREMLVEANASDIVLFQHVVDHVYPRQIEAYSGNLEKDVNAFRLSNESFSWGPRFYLNRVWRTLVFKPWMKKQRRLYHDPATPQHSDVWTRS